MKKFILAAIALSVFFATEALAQCVCSRVVGVPPNIYKQSAPLRRGGIGTPIVGFRREPTLISNQRGLLPRGRIKVCNRNNQQLTTCPWASAHGHSGGRARCTIQTSTLRRRALATSQSPAVRFQGNNGVCVQVPDAGRCVGSVKGLCNRLIS